MQRTIDMSDPRERRRRVLITAAVLAAVALFFYIAVFVRFW